MLNPEALDRLIVILHASKDQSDIFVDQPPQSEQGDDNEDR